MLRIAWLMLVGDRGKYIGIIIGLSFASFIITQQAAIMVGIVYRTFGFVTDTSQPNIWVMDPTVQFIDDIKPMKDSQLFRVRGVEGVEWAVPLYKGLIQARLPNGAYQTCFMLGIDDATLIGGPPIMVEGTLEDLRRDGAIIVDQVGANTKLATIAENGDRIPLQVGEVMELNDNRAVVVGICKVSRTFLSQPLIYATYNRATTFVPTQRKLLSFILVQSDPDKDPSEVCKMITAATGLAAYTPYDLKMLNLNYYMKNTGIFVNFGVAILLGFIIGTTIAGQTLYNFTLDKLPYFGVFKAMGASNRILTRMVLLQAVFVSCIGWGIGVGAASLFGFLSSGTELSFSLPLWLYLASGSSILVISLMASFLCIHTVVNVDPAIVFKS